MFKKEISRAICGLLVTSWCLLAVVPCLAGDVTGTVSLGTRGIARDAVIYLEGDKKASPMVKAVIDQRQKTFIPHVSVVTVGTIIQFPNNDTVFHNVFAYFDAKKFDLGMYPRGATKTVSFDKKGVVALLCNVHSEMSAYIMIVDTPYYAVADKDGKFTVKNVPPGDYTLRAWHESGAIYTQQLKVAAGDTKLSIAVSRK